MLLHILGVGLAGDGEGVISGLVELCAEVENVLNGLSAAGNKALHLVNVSLYAAGKGGINVGLAVGSGGDNTEVIGYHVPLDVKAEVPFNCFAAAAGIFLGAPLAYLVKRGLKFKASSAEAGSAAAREVMALDKERLFSGNCHSAGCGQTAVAGADYDRIIFRHNNSSCKSDMCGNTTNAAG